MQTLFCDKGFVGYNAIMNNSKGSGLRRKILHKVRIFHRYLGYFVAGLMTIYALTGVVLLFRDTHFLKKKILVERNLETRLSARDFTKMVAQDSTLNLRKLKIIDEKNGVLIFDKNRYNSAGTYDGNTGKLSYFEREYPYTVDILLKIHKSRISDPYSFINILSGASLFFLVFTSFWMFDPRSPVFKKGLKYVLIGIALAVLALFIG